MPFPLAHPAAVLPLRRFCPRRLSFPALVIGSVSPDVGYCFGISSFSHSFFPGSFAFCVPVGLVMLVVFYSIRRPIAAILPPRLSKAFLPLCQRPVAAPLPIVLSLLIGVWTHLFLDSITHENGWLVEHLPLLQKSVPLPWKTGFKGNDLIYAGITLLGVAWLAVCYWRWLETAAASRKPTKPWVMRSCALLLAIPITGAAIAAHGDDPSFGGLAAGIISTLLAAIFLAGTGIQIIID